MIERISFVTYRKLKNLEIELSAGVNAISGANGTCKSSILHVISNSFQAVPSTSEWLSDRQCILNIRRINSSMNPKIESLTRGDREYSDPAPGTEGTLFRVQYRNGKELAFRRHNSRKGSGVGRFSVKPYYSKGRCEKLPAVPVLYLGLARLYPYGEYAQDSQVKRIRGSLPQRYLDRLAENYEEFTLLNVAGFSAQAMGDVKNRAEFVTDSEGIDSNTISAGEDNLFIILMALESLAYYHDSVTEGYNSSSVLLIDELDACLHPAFQIMLASLFRKYADEFSIQVVFTTHSLTLLDDLLTRGETVIYLRDNLTDVIPMKSPDMYQIKMDLNDRTSSDVYSGKCIPLFSEDREARLVINEIFDFFEDNSANFSRVRRHFHFVDGDIGADNLRSLFKDPYLLQSTLSSICILDGDKGSQLRNNTIKLPGNGSPEKWLFNYACELEDEDDLFWREDMVLRQNFNKRYFVGTIKKRFNNIEHKIASKAEKGESIHSIRRKCNKAAFNDYKQFFLLVLRRWLYDERCFAELSRFYNELHSIFMKVAEYHGIDKEAWPKEDYLQQPKKASRC